MQHERTLLFVKWKMINQCLWVFFPLFLKQGRVRLLWLCSGKMLICTLVSHINVQSTHSKNWVWPNGHFTPWANTVLVMQQKLCHNSAHCPKCVSPVAWLHQTPLRMLTRVDASSSHVFYGLQRLMSIVLSVFLSSTFHPPRRLSHNLSTISELQSRILSA